MDRTEIGPVVIELCNCRRKLRVMLCGESTEIYTREQGRAWAMKKCDSGDLTASEKDALIARFYEFPLSEVSGSVDPNQCIAGGAISDCYSVPDQANP